MTDKYKQQYNKMMRGGAKPRRVDPIYLRPIVLSFRQAVGSSCVLIALGGFLIVAGGALAGFRPAGTDEIRLARIVRAAVPDVDAISQDDLVGRLTVPPRFGRLLAPVAATDPNRISIGSESWLSGFLMEPPALTTRDRMVALGEFATALAALPERDRTDALNYVVQLYTALGDPNSHHIIARIGALPRATRDELANSLAFGPLLAAIAALPEEKRLALADGRLQLLPDDPERLRLIRSIPKLEPPEVKFVNRLADLTDPALRQAFIFIVDAVQSGDPAVMRMLTSFWYHDPRLMAAIAASPSPQGSKH